MIRRYEDLTIRQYADICRICRTDSDEVDKQVEILAILNECETTAILDTGLVEFSQMAKQAQFLERECEGLMSYKPAKVYRIDGVDYVPTADIRKITTAQFVDLQTLQADGRTMEDKLGAMLALFLIPKGHKYGDGYDFDAVSETISDRLSIYDALGLIAFFLRRYMRVLLDSQTYLGRELERMTRTAETFLHNSPKNGDGCAMSMRSQS